MDNLTKEMADGADAQRLLDSKAYKESLGKVKQGIIQAMEAAKRAVSGPKIVRP